MSLVSSSSSNVMTQLATLVTYETNVDVSAMMARERSRPASMVEAS